MLPTLSPLASSCAQSPHAQRGRRAILTASLLFAALALSSFSPPSRADAPSSAAPLFSAKLISTSQAPAQLDTYRGKPLIVNFWARWCGPCRQEIPLLNQAQGKLAKAQVELLGLALEERGETVSDFAKAYEINYPLFLTGDNGIELMKALGNEKAALPFTIGISRQGQIVYRKLGPLHGNDLDQLIKTLSH